METTLESALHDAGLRATAGRVAVLEAMESMAHTDAERVFRAVSDQAEDGALTDWREAVARCSVQLRDFIRGEYGV